MHWQGRRCVADEVEKIDQRTLRRSSWEYLLCSSCCLNRQPPAIVQLYVDWLTVPGHGHMNSMGAGGGWWCDDVATIWFTDQFVSRLCIVDLHMKTFNSLIKSGCAVPRTIKIAHLIRFTLLVWCVYSMHFVITPDLTWWDGWKGSLYIVKGKPFLQTTDMMIAWANSSRAVRFAD